MHGKARRRRDGGEAGGSARQERAEALTECSDQSQLRMYGINMQLMRSKHILFGLMCLIVVLWAEAQHGDIEIIDSLPPQGAAGMLASFDMPLMSLHLNGTRLRFNPRPRPGAPYDMSSTMWVQVTSIREYHRPGHSCGMDDGVLVNEIALSTCEHSYSEIRIEENGVLTTGYRMNLANCTGNERLSVSLNFTTANATTTSTYGPTLNGSLYDYFTYTSAYVQQLSALPAELGKLPIFSARLSPSTCFSLFSLKYCS